MTRHSAAPAPTGAVNWAMVMPLDDASRRRDYIAGSAECALLASAAKRRLRDLDLDATETQTVTNVRDQFRQAAESLRGGQDIVTVPALGIATFRGLATAVEAVKAPQTTPLPEGERAARLDAVADMLTAVLKWADSPESRVLAQKATDLFATASKDLLRNVARSGESIERPGRRMLA